MGSQDLPARQNILARWEHVYMSFHFKIFIPGGPSDLMSVLHGAMIKTN